MRTDWFWTFVVFATGFGMAVARDARGCDQVTLSCTCDSGD